MTDQPRLIVDLSDQSLELREGGAVIKHYQVSTALNGAGELRDSECTPRGRHEISEMFGHDAEQGTVFVGRRATGEIYSPQLAAEYPTRDWILTRILWLSGREPGRNKGGACDSKSRYIYVHGSPDEVSLGTPGSRGCIRMRNTDVIELFDRVRIGTLVEIHD